jgi:hypothetical protein
MGQLPCRMNVYTAKSSRASLSVVDVRGSTMRSSMSDPV